MKKTYLSLILFVLSVISFASGQGQIKMIFRYDDYILYPSHFNDSLLNIFKKYKIPLCLGVIPFDAKSNLINKLDPSQIRDLMSRIKNNEVEIGLHGFNHANNVRNSFLKRRYSSEFASVSYNDQYYKIKRGKNVLDSLLKINIETFIPPFDTYDDNTLDVLTGLGFKTISASIYGSTAGIASNSKIQYMPGTLRDFSELPAILNKHKDEDITIIVYFHNYTFDNFSSNYKDEKSPAPLITLNEFDTLISRVSRQNISFYTFSELAKTGQFDQRLYEANYYKDNLVKTLLYKYKKYRYGVYSTLDYHYSHLELSAGNLLIHLVVFMLVYLVVYGLVRLLRPGKIIVTLFLSILIISVCGYLYYFIDDSSFKMKFIILFVMVSATILGIVKGRRKLYPLSARYIMNTE